MFKLCNKSDLTNKLNEMVMPISHDLFNAQYANWQKGAFIQDAFPTLNPDEREFIKTGITPEEWNDVFG
jgi:hypothetical protein